MGLQGYISSEWLLLFHFKWMSESIAETILPVELGRLWVWERALCSGALSEKKVAMVNYNEGLWMLLSRHLNTKTHMSTSVFFLTSLITRN